MKKVLIAMCAMAAVMACTKTEVVFDEPNEIAFSPVSKFETKAAVTGTNFTAGQNFYVFADTKSDVKYFENVEFEPETGTVDGTYQVYKGKTPQYWPNVETLKFAGVTKSGSIDGTTVKAEMSTWGTMTVTGYTQPLPNVADAKNDLMYFFDDNSTAGYGKGTDYVNPEMKHACSWITINVKAQNSSLLSYWTNLKVTSVKFVSLVSAGTPTFTTSGASWSTSATGAEVSVLSTAKDVTINSQEFADVPNNTIVIPQKPSKLSVTYTYTSPANATVTEIATLSLNYDGKEDAETAAWVAGVHYTYDLTIGADEIKIDPKSEDWTSYDADSSKDGVQNIEQDVK